MLKIENRRSKQIQTTITLDSDVQLIYLIIYDGQNWIQKLSPNFIKCQKFFLLKIKTNTYSVSEQKDKNGHEPSKQFGSKLQ